MPHPEGRKFSVLEHFGAAYAAIVLSIVGVDIADKPIEKPKAVSSHVATELLSTSPVASAQDAGPQT